MTWWCVLWLEDGYTPIDNVIRDINRKLVSKDSICEKVAIDSGDWCDLSIATTKTIGEWHL